MKNIICFLSIIVSTTAIYCQDSTKVNKADLLILSPQGVNPANDNVGFNKLVSNVTQAFAKSLIDTLKTRNLSVVNVINQDTKYKAAEKLAYYSAINLANSAVVLTIETDQVGDDSRILLNAQHLKNELEITNGKVTGFKTLSAVDKSYVLRSSVSGDTHKTIKELAADFVGFLIQNNCIK